MLMVLIFELVLSILLELLFQKFFLYRLLRLSDFLYLIPNCIKFIFFLLSVINIGTFCDKAYIKKIKKLKKKESDLLMSAKLQAPIKNIDAESRKITMQNMCLECTVLKSEIERMKFEIENEFIKKELHHIFRINLL